MRCRAFSEPFGVSSLEAFRRWCLARRGKRAWGGGRTVREFDACNGCATGRAVAAGRLKRLPRNVYKIEEV